MIIIYYRKWLTCSIQFLLMKNIRLLVLFIVILSSCKESDTTTKPVLQDMTESIYASLIVLPKDFYEVQTERAGVIETIYISEGDSVFDGQILAALRFENPELNLDKAKLNLDLNQSKLQGSSTLLASLEDEIQIAIKQASLDSLNYMRQEELWSKNIGSLADLENKKLKYQLSQNQVLSLQKKYNQSKLELESAYLQSKNQLASAQVELSNYLIYSQINGQVYSLNKKEGEAISPQEIFAQIGKKNEFILELSIDEVDITKISNGQKIIVLLDAYENEVFNATVTKIYPLKNAQTQTFKVEAKFIKTPPKLYSGLSGEANIIIAEKTQVLTLPLEYLIDEKQVKTENGLVDVEIGLKNLEFAQILAGLDTNTIVLKP